MPRGYYLGQGLIPLGEHSSDDEEGPCELPDGRIVCGPHGLVICHRCCSNYDFAEHLSDAGHDSDEDDHEGLTHACSGMAGELRKGTGRVLPSIFTPPYHATPLDVFSKTGTFADFTRYTRPTNPREMLVLTDGACLNNGGPNPRAGWAFVHGPGKEGLPHVVSSRLERKGPFEDDAVETSNRAELRAVIAALRFRWWPGEGFSSMVVATDSEYVVLGATQWVRSWIRRGWKTAQGEDVKNRDLWELLLGEVEAKSEAGLAVRFWRIPREWNQIADYAVKQAAAEGTPDDTWTDVPGFISALS